MTKAELEQYRSIAAEIQKLKTEQNKRNIALLDTLETQKRHIEDFIHAIPDSVTRRIFTYRYIDGAVKPSWQWIAFKIGGGNTADGVKKRVYRYIAQNSIARAN